jgi:putative flippase GtrA
VSNVAGPSTGVRWLMFNGVGLLGALVQLSTLALLVHLAQVHYLLATASAVEAAVLHNFAWHQRWTWRDRASGMDRRAAWAALGRFHVANGLVSLAGNVVLMALLVGALHLPPVAANALAILACSVVNYVLGDRWVFVASSREPEPAPVRGADSGSDDRTIEPPAAGRLARGLTVAAGPARTPARSRCTTG